MLVIEPACSVRPFDSLQSGSNPSLYLIFRPCHRVSTKLHRLWELSFAHPAIDRRSAQPDTMLHFRQTNEASAGLENALKPVIRVTEIFA